MPLSLLFDFPPPPPPPFVSANDLDMDNKDWDNMLRPFRQPKVRIMYGRNFILSMSGGEDDEAAAVDGDDNVVAAASACLWQQWSFSCLPVLFSKSINFDYLRR